MDIKKEKQDVEASVPNVSVKVELVTDFIDVEDIKTEFLEENCNDLSTPEQTNEFMQLTTSIKVGSST